MAKIDDRRKLFNKFSRQLHLLKDNGLINIDLKYDKTYICPICLDQFQEDDIVSSNIKNFLTEEDAPPAKLNGRRVVLTCKACNSRAGYEIDNHLVNRIKESDDNTFYKGSVQFRNFDFDGQNITAEISSNGDGTLQVLHIGKKNNPTLLDKFIYGIKNKTIGPILNLKPKNYNVDSDRVNRALLKSSYILTFSKFGYIFLLESYYQSIRDEINNMKAEPTGQLFLTNQLNESNIGSYYILNNGVKSIFNVFSLGTQYSQTIISSIIPLPGITPEEIHRKLTESGYNINQPGKIGVNLNVSTYDMNADLFTDLKEINKILVWKNN